MNSRNPFGGAVAALLFFVSTLSGCDRGAEQVGPQFGSRPASGETPIYRFAVHPLHNPAKLTQAYQPLIDYINARLKGGQLTLEASRDYANFEEKYGARKPEFILPNPWQTLQAMKRNYHVVAMAGEPSDFTGIFIVRKESGLKRPSDLKGKAVSYPSSTALAACIMPQYFLYKNGIDVNKEIDNRYVGSQESSIMNAYMKLTAAAATWRTPWRAFQREHPREAAELELIWETESLVNNSVMARDDVPQQITDEVRTLLLGLDAAPEGQAILAGMETARFLSAADKDYDVVRDYVDRFEKSVRPIGTR